MEVDMKLPEERVAILDAGSQFGKVIDRRIRELNIYCEVCVLIIVDIIIIKLLYKLHNILIEYQENKHLL